MNFIKKLFSGGRKESEHEVGRNEMCWCGSGKKYKRCHLEADSRKKSSKLSAVQGKHTPFKM